MAFIVPDFNIVCDIYTGPWASRVLRVTSSCQLTAGRRVGQLAVFATDLGYVFGGFTSLLLPARTDVRDASCGSGNDVVECPQGTGRWYWVMNVDDVARGFPNEYRQAALAKVSDDLTHAFPGVHWPTPIS